MREYEEHPSKPASWRAGQMVVLPQTDCDACTVWASAERDTDGALRWEGLLARRLGADRAQICSVPFWLYGLNLGDEAALIASEEGAAVITGVKRDAGNYTFRVIFENAIADDQRWREVMIDLEHFGCWFDVRSPSYVALSAPHTHGQAVANYLLDREQRGELRYEAGRAGPRDRVRFPVDRVATASRDRSDRSRGRICIGTATRPAACRRQPRKPEREDLTSSATSPASRLSPTGTQPAGLLLSLCAGRERKLSSRVFVPGDPAQDS